MKAMKAAGIHVVESPALLGETMERVLRARKLLRALPPRAKAAKAARPAARRRPARARRAPARRAAKRSR
jgi:hypothetical protein